MRPISRVTPSRSPNKLLVLDIHRAAERYVRAVIVRGTADATVDGVIAILYGSRVLPVTSDSTVAGNRDARLAGRGDRVVR